MIDSVGIYEEPANVSEIVDTGGLRTGRAGNVEQLENGVEFVIDVSMIGAGAVCLCAVVAGSLAAVILAKELIKGRAGKVHCQESAVDLAQKAVVGSTAIDVKPDCFEILFKVVVDPGDLGLHRTRKVLGGEMVRQGKHEPLVYSHAVGSRQSRRNR